MEPERSVMRSYPARGWGWEVTGDNHDWAIGEGLEEPPAGRSRRVRVNAKAAVELWRGALQRGMHDIATQDHGCSLRLHNDTDVAGGVPWPRLDPYVVIEGIVRGDQLGLATVHDREQTVFVIRIGGVRGSQFGPSASIGR